jgi:hypothetical protein
MREAHPGSRGGDLQGALQGPWRGVALQGAASGGGLSPLDRLTP